MIQTICQEHIKIYTALHPHAQRLMLKRAILKMLSEVIPRPPVAFKFFPSGSPDSRISTPK